MSFDSQNVEHLLTSIAGVIDHYEATKARLTAIGQGGTPPTIGSDDNTRIFAFGPNVETAAYLSQYQPRPLGELREDFSQVTLPTRDQFNQMSAEARKVPRHTGLRRWFTRRPVEGEQAITQLSAMNVSAIHAILGGIDAALGTSPDGSFEALRPEQFRDSIEADLTRLTGWPVQWVSSSRVNAHADAVAQLDSARDLAHRLESDVQHAGRALAKHQAEATLAKTDISVLDHITDGRLRLGPLKHLTLRQIADAQPVQLQRYEGVGEKTATQAIAAARTYCADVVETQTPHIDYQDKLPSTDYVVALARLLTFRDTIRDLPTEAMQLARVPEGTLVALAGEDNLLEQVRVEPPSMFTPDQAWALYAVRAAEFHAYGDSSAGTEVPEEIAERIADIHLGGTLHASLRGYQAFGAKFALAQRKVLIGDEMGLGKTMQALAVITHLAAKGHTTALVVCPPSLRINWARELTKFTDLVPHVLHGPDKDVAYEAWKLDGGVAIAGFPEVRNNPELTSRVLDVLIVDEAHRAKNPRSLQSQGVHALTQGADIAIYLTGTPLENRVSEFETLLAYLDPTIVDTLEDLRGKPSAFQAAITSVYLRRNQADVLDELPPLTEVEEWIEPKPAQVQGYHDAVRRGHFMDMRQAFSGTDSAKMERITELLDDGAEAGKTIIFTYFRGVLGDLMAVLGDRAYGPIAGGVSHAERQQAVDDFTAAEAGAVLVAQITAASEGLNIQAANRIILFEPQLNPAVEAQAIARAHRMGQVNTVEVHRLLTPDSLEERLVEMLNHKRTVFDQFARDSAAAEANPEAMDISEAQLIEQVIAAERERIGEPEQL
ncbi:DEAD/DEAH box helicase [Corynebacterium cystitidis]|uniref:DEAD/DEAH box helicase n=1 Tax=Corynebacterium cystitidis TaxID=35757 RepID=UPI001E556885|nr:DEAD/DEAH box helicase [Corynebacterium cystitidis]